MVKWSQGLRFFVTSKCHINISANL
uniref:Uncharacterized protein n=1 Tax=Arundo donax TaxID=35708 RepID=A0A0A8XQ75_ARUDO